MCPSILRTDLGSETGTMSEIHSSLHQGGSSHLYGKSTANQRIENWWSSFKKKLFILGNKFFQRFDREWGVYSWELQSYGVCLVCFFGSHSS